MANMIDEFNEKVRKIKERRSKPGANKMTDFEEKKQYIIKLLEKAEEYFTSDAIPYELQCDDDFKEARLKVWSAKQQTKMLGEQFGKDYGWTLVEDEYPVHNTEVLVSLAEEDEMTLARYDKDKGFLGYKVFEEGEVKAWCEIPEWYDWTYVEPELTEEERKDNYYDMKFHELQEHGEI